MKPRYPLIVPAGLASALAHFGFRGEKLGGTYQINVVNALDERTIFIAKHVIDTATARDTSRAPGAKTRGRARSRCALRFNPRL